MKQLNDFDIANMIGADFIPDDNGTKKSVRQSLHLSTRIPKQTPSAPTHARIDFHQHTEEESWQMLVQVAASGAKSVTVITGASGILKQKFQQWVRESILSPQIISCTPINNGSFEIVLRKRRD